MSSINPVLVKERSKATFDGEELTNIYDGGVSQTERRRKMTDFFLNDDRLKSEIPFEYLSYAERYEEGIRRSCITFEKFFEWQETHGVADMETFRTLLGCDISDTIAPDGTPFGINYLMFLPAIASLGTPEQQSKWATRAWKLQIIGTYAQTELGHGTHIRGLETTATYDVENKEFILNTPTLTAHKWWPAGLGHTANYAVVFAQLSSLGQSYGPHAFVVQLRDEETHMPLPGINIGEIGCKMGLNGINQGFLGFENVRIPRENMLMKSSEICEDGTYIKTKSTKKNHYGTMLFVRVLLVKTPACSSLAKAVTIATRYSCIRKQSEIRPGEGETFIIEFKTQQYKIFPHIAAVMMMSNAALSLNQKFSSIDYSDVNNDEIEGKIAELHALACCLKAIATSDAARGIDECRKSCGGHGYISSSGFPVLFCQATAAETYEGENTVLMLQTARYLLKTWQQAKRNEKLAESVQYLRSHSSANKNWTNKIEFSIENLVNLYKQVSVGLLDDTSKKIDKMIASGIVQEEAWNNYANQLILCVEWHCRQFMLDQYRSLIGSVSSNLKQVLEQLGELYGVYFLLKNFGYFLMYSDLKYENVGELRDWQNSLLTALRPNCVAIVDSFDISDQILQSTIGAYDGNAYQRLFEEAKKSPLNASPVPPTFEKYLKPLKSKL